MSKSRRDVTGTIIGLVVFLVGVGLIVATFASAKEMFAVEPGSAIGINQGETLNINRVTASMAGVLVKIVLLVVMSAIGSVVASRGIKLYVQAGGVVQSKADDEKDTKAMTATIESGRDDKI